MGRRYDHLTLEERCTIARMRESGKTIRQIAASMDRAASSISREVRRNCGRSYKPAYADDPAWSRRWRGSRLMREPELQRQVLAGLSSGWSPEQVSGRMALGGGVAAEPRLWIDPDYRYRPYAKDGKLRAGLDKHLRFKMAASDSSLARNRWE